MSMKIDSRINKMPVDLRVSRLNRMSTYLVSSKIFCASIGPKQPKGRKIQKT